MPDTSNMWNAAIYFIGAIAVLFFLFKFCVFIWFDNGKPKENPEDVKISITDILPYRSKDNFLTTPEMSFYVSLHKAVGTQAVICPKVGLKDIFFLGKDTKDYMKYWGKISQKHVDFLLCDPKTMNPFCGIELDDASHESAKAKERDAFVEKVYKDAELPLVRVKTQPSYTIEDIIRVLTPYLGMPVPQTVICPKCNIPLVQRVSKSSGEKFYGCKNYPNCRETAKMG